MRKNLSLFKVISLVILVFISCSENELETKETCQNENSTIEVNRLLKKLITTLPGNLPTIRNYEFSYNNFNQLVIENEYTFDYDEYKNYSYCNNNLKEVNDESNYTYDASNRLVAYHTSNSYLHNYELVYNDDEIIVSGVINNQSNSSITLVTNNNNLVIKINREDGFSTFDYDNNGNLISAKDFDTSNELLNEYKISYDANPNPFYGQFTSSYLERFIFYFSKSAFMGIDNFFRFNQYNFPYLKNNPILLEDLSCQPCYKDLLQREYEYDVQNYPVKMEESYVGSPKVIYEFKYYSKQV
ncbi:hypothetical protein [Tenacibaculum aiptasiae]|uniref:hypothetical protein n=1 Tax=Tenacibaculum aiptasiae TaxID=426481 RepID=UPI00232FA661|nr:hypothetical protein [Tenacibaculum aiptasiae]